MQKLKKYLAGLLLVAAFFVQPGVGLAEESNDFSGLVDKSVAEQEVFFKEKIFDQAVEGENGESDADRRCQSFYRATPIASKKIEIFEKCRDDAEKYDAGTLPENYGVIEEITAVEEISSTGSSESATDLAEIVKNGIIVELETPIAKTKLDNGNIVPFSYPIHADRCVDDFSKESVDADICIDDDGNYWRRLLYSDDRSDSEREVWRQVIIGEDGNEILESFARYAYIFLASVVGLLSVLMLVIGGIQISLGGVNADGVSAGKDRIVAALVGLVLLFLASLILYTINPNFFTL